MITRRSRHLLVAALAGASGGWAVVASAATILVDLQPTYLEPILIQGDVLSLGFLATYNNSTGATISIVGYVQDDVSCPMAVSAHDWIPLANPIQGSVPSDGSNHGVNGSVPFDATAQLPGVYKTNICLLEEQAVPAVHALPVQLTVVTGSAVQLAGSMVHVTPNLIGLLVHPGDTGSVPLAVTFQNNTGASLNVTGYVQDDASCPQVPSAHDWIPLTPFPGLVPSDNQPHEVSATIPLDASALSSGTFRTHVCIEQEGAPRYVAAVPVELRVVAGDDIFQNGFD